MAHIRSLELNEIQIEAEAKINQYKQENNKEFESIAFTPKAKDINAATPSHISDDVNHEFDALFKKSVQGNLPPATDFTKNVLPEPDLQSETVEEYIPQIKETAAEIEPLEFNFSFDQTKVETQVAEPLDQKIETEIIETPPNIDFNTSDIALAPIEPILDNSLSAQSDIANEVELPPIELALEQPRIIETTPESLSLLSLDTALDVSSAPLDFSHESNDISVDQIRDSISQYDLNDPIIQAFPEVAQLNEINLNFELATQYIELGAYDAARAIIAEQESQYNNEQRHFANQLLNKIET